MYDDDDDVNGDVDMMHCSGAATGMDVFCSFGKRTYVTTSFWMLMSILVAMT